MTSVTDRYIDIHAYALSITYVDLYSNLLVSFSPYYSTTAH